MQADPKQTAGAWDEDDDYDPYEPTDDCDHAEADVDVLEGRMSCRCGYSRFLSGEEIRREAKLQAEMMEAYYRECEQTELDAKAAT